MDLQAVELVQRHHVDETEQIPLGDEVPGRIDQKAPPGKTRMVGDLGAGYIPYHLLCLRATEYRRRQKLPQGLDAVEQPRRLRRDDRDSLRRHTQLIPFHAEHREALVQSHLDRPLARLQRRRQLQRESHRRCQSLDQLLRFSRRSPLRQDACRWRDAKDPFQPFGQDRSRNHVDPVTIHLTCDRGPRHQNHDHHHREHCCDSPHQIGRAHV